MSLAQPKNSLTSGLDKVLAVPELACPWKRFAVVTHASSTDAEFRPCAEALYLMSKEGPCELVSIFGPQHGYWQCEPYNMYETPHDQLSLPGGRNVPLYSLYGEDREPQPEHLEGLDTLVVDLPDIGCRVYTYMTTLAGCLKQASRLGKKVVVLDRTNPLGLSCPLSGPAHRTEGNLMDLNLRSFVGWFAIPMRHGLTLGELGHLFIEQEQLEVDYDVIPVSGLSRSERSSPERIDVPQLPSPNMPTHDSMKLFPALVPLEGTNISEGRGTTVPFLCMGAPFLNENSLSRVFSEVLDHLYPMKVPRPRFRPTRFFPRFDKFQDQVCHGLAFDAHTPPDIATFPLAIAVLAAVICSGGEHFRWRENGYEYNFVQNPLDLILGSPRWRLLLEALPGHENLRRGLDDLRDELERACKEAEEFQSQAQKYWLY